MAERDEIISIAKTAVEQYVKNAEGDVTKGSITEEELLKELNKYIRTIEKTVSDQAKRTIQENSKRNQLIEKLQGNVIKKLEEQGVISKPSFWQKIGLTTSNKDDLATQYRARQMAGGIESIMEGRFASGLRQLASTVPQIANFMGGPYYLALQTVVSGLLKLDSALSKATKTATSMTGGIYSERLGGLEQRFSNMSFVARTRADLHDIGMGSEYNNIVSALTKGYGYGTYQGRQKDFITSMAYAQKGLSSLGISADTSNSLLSNLRLLEGKDTTGIYAQLKRFLDRSLGNKELGLKPMSYLSPEEAMKQTMTLFDQTKNLGLNFEWANRAVAKFEEQLKRGTMSLSDFAAVNRSLQSGGISKNAGLGALITDYAARTGINLPSEFLNSNAIGQGFALSHPNLIKNRNILNAYQGQLSEMVQQMGGSNRYEQAGALQLILQSRGINVSAEAALKAINKDGTVDLERAEIIGKAANEKRQKQQQQAEEYENAVKDYYTGSEGYAAKMMNWVKGIHDKVVGTPNETAVQAAKIIDEAKPGMAKKLINLSLNVGQPNMIEEA